METRRERGREREKRRRREIISHVFFFIWFSTDKEVNAKIVIDGLCYANGKKKAEVQQMLHVSLLCCSTCLRSGHVTRCDRHKTCDTTIITSLSSCHFFLFLLLLVSLSPSLLFSPLFLSVLCSFPPLSLLAGINVSPDKKYFFVPQPRIGILAIFKVGE